MVASKYPGANSTNYGCGGWMGLVSDYIFGKTDLPARKINFKDTRPGDMVVILDENGKLKHFAIAIARPEHDTECELWRLRTTDAGGSPDVTTWGKYGCTEYDDGYLADRHAVWTRYPD